MQFERFSQGQSILHRTDPLVKIISAAATTLPIALCHEFRTASAGLLVGIVLTAAARLPLSEVRNRLLIVNSFNFLLLIMLPLTYSTGPFVQFAGMPVSISGLQLAGLITIKANAILLLVISLLATSTIVGLGHGLQKLHLSPRLCMLLLFSYRYVFVIEQEYRQLHRAAELRCFTPSTSIHTCTTYGHLMGMLLVKSWNRAARVQQAMELRGFSGTLYHLHGVEMRKNDYILLAVMLTTAAGLLFLEFFS